LYKLKINYLITLNWIKKGDSDMDNDDNQEE
jgi:hypothetical protein